MEKRKFPATQAEALRQGVTYYFTGKPCKHGHLSERFAKNKNCRECLRIRNRARTKKDYWLDYGDEAYKQHKRDRAKRYADSEAHKRAVKNRRYFEKKSRVATDKGITELRRIRLEAQLLSIDTGIKHEVDHIIPLIHELVCGLDVPDNVQVLTKAANRQKASRFDSDRQSQIQDELIKKKPSKEG
jgi:YHS domain-containing protein